MAHKENPHSRKEWEAKIIAHAWKDASFKKLLLSNPKEALKQIDCPYYDKFKVNVIEEKENSMTLVLPHSPTDVKNLSDAQLVDIAGGTMNKCAPCKHDNPFTNG